MRIKIIALAAVLCTQLLTAQQISEQITMLEKQAKATVYMLQAMNILFDKNKEIPNEPIMRCGSCKKRFLTLGIASAVITADVCKDLENGRDTFAIREPYLKECLTLLADGGSDARIKAFVFYVGTELGYACSPCKTSCWEMISSKKKKQPKSRMLAGHEADKNSSHSPGQA